MVTSTTFTIDISSLDGASGFRLDGGGPGLESGKSVSAAGDVNGDGFDDVIISAPGGRYGLSYVVFGRASGFDARLSLSNLNGSDGFRLKGGESNGSASHSVSNAGDINGDGYDDVIIGHGFDGTSGSSYVVFGKASGFNAALDLSSLDGSNGFRVDGVAESDGLGDSVSTAGDVNGDGFGDLIIGAFSADTNGYWSGSSYVIFGKAFGFDSTLDLSSLDGNNGFRLDGAEAYDFSGSPVSSAGDVNSDGFDDLIIGADPKGDGSGASYVIFGQASGFAATLDLSSLDGSNGFRLDGVAADDYSGSSVSGAGDINGDGFDDVIVGALLADPNGDRSGSSYVIFGRASGLDAAINLSSLDGNNGFRLDGGAAGDLSGASVSNAGDVNGDGFDDLLVGAVGAPNGYGAGFSYVVFGRASGFDATMDLSNLGGRNGFRVNGLASYSLGFSVSAAGDVNDDGFDDVIIGAPGAQPNGGRSGSSFVIFGSSDITGTLTYVGTAGDDVLTGTSAAEIFEAAGGNDMMAGGGGADVFRGSGGDDTMQVIDFNFHLADGGRGIDALSLGGSGLTLDLASFSEKVKDIEAVDLTGSGDNILNLKAVDFFGLSNTSDTLVVNGDAGDRVTGLNGGWMDAGIQDEFRVFTQGAATLLIHTDVSTNPPAGGIFSLSVLDGTNGFRLDGAEHDRSVSSVSNAGDVNGDGFDDVIIGAPLADPNGDRSGSSYVVFGRASGFDSAINLSSLDGNNGFRLDGGAAGDLSGVSVSNAGDVNGDGFDDVIIGAYRASPNGRSSGASYVVFGKASGFDATMDLSTLDGSNGFRLDGSAEDNIAGFSVSSAGDVNGDGFDDVFVGSRVRDYSIPLTVGHLVFGQASGFSPALNLSSLDGDSGFNLLAKSFYGSNYAPITQSASSAGDINGDGYDDLIIGVSFSGDSSRGYVVFGKATGFDAALSLSSLDGSNGFQLTGLRDSRYESAISVSGAGDINGDGFDDLIVGSATVPRAGSYYSYDGVSFVVFGKPAGFDATLDLSHLDGSNGFRVDAMAEGYHLGSSVSGAGDVNGDGFDDLIIGAPGASPNGDASGSSYVVFGKAAGFAATLNLFIPDSVVRLDGAAAGDFSGASVSSAGDVNSDGFDDLIVGAPGVDRYGERSGSSYVVFGSRDFGGGQLPVIPGTPGDDVLRGTSAAEIFEAGDGNDLLIGHGGADVFHGGAGVDQIKVPDLNFASIDGGTGNDILHLDGKDLNLDLASFGGKIHGIETICIYGRGDNTLMLTADSVLNLSDTS
ncbi:MAG: hypothetical protein DYH15_12845, partial [Nitrosomonas sp. PRO4]|nr:hypothetical protein [Nitrosomonas sp. PRO4]